MATFYKKGAKSWDNFTLNLLLFSPQFRVESRCQSLPSTAQQAILEVRFLRQHSGEVGDPEEVAMLKIGSAEDIAMMN